MICIICREDKAEGLFSVEHIIPEAVRGNLKISDVCRECNSQMGLKIDSELANCVFTKVAMHRLGIAPPKGVVPHQFAGFSAETAHGNRLSFKADHLGNVTGYSLTPKITKSVSNDSHSISILADPDYDFVHAIKKYRARHQLPDIASAEILNSATTERLEIDKVTFSTSIDRAKIELALLKIAYEMTFYWLGQEYLSDTRGIEVSQQIKNYLVSGLYQPKRGIEIDLDCSILPDFQVWESEPTKHIVCLARYENAIVVYLRILNQYFGKFLVSREADKYGDIGQMFLSIDTLTGERLNTTLGVEKERLYKRIIGN